MRSVFLIEENRILFPKNYSEQITFLLYGSKRSKTDIWGLLVELYTVATTEPSFTKHMSVTGLVF